VDWTEKRKMVMLLSKGKRLIIKLNANKVSKKRRQTLRPGRDNATMDFIM
jgi:hypothetical protein